MWSSIWQHMRQTLYLAKNLTYTKERFVTKTAQNCQKQEVSHNSFLFLILWHGGMKFLLKEKYFLYELIIIQTMDARHNTTKPKWFGPKLATSRH